MKKRLLSALLAGSLILGLSVGASAASVTTGVAQNDGTITVSGAVSNAVSGQQVTILVVKDGTDLDDLTSDDVAYIDQVSATGDYSVSFQMPTTMTYGTYDVYVGGSEVTTLATTEFTLEGSHTLSGAVGTSVSGANLTKIWVRVYNQGTETLVAEGKVAADGSFSMAIPSGTYDIKVGREGYLTKVYNNVIISEDNTTLTSGLKLLAGDIDGNLFINGTDFGLLTVSYGKAVDEILTAADLDDNTFVNGTDVGFLASNYGSNY